MMTRKSNRFIVFYSLIWILLDFRIEAADVIAFTIPSTQLFNASQVLDPRFAGFGIEFSNVFSFTGTAESPNILSYNLLDNLRGLTGVGPCIRIGGNTQDNSIYESNFTEALIGLNPYPTLQPSNPDYVPWDLYVYGPQLFDALASFPITTQYIYGLNLAYNNPDYLDRITSTASAVLSALESAIYSFEIGNEPDLYDSTSPFRAGQTWNGQVYTSEWLTRAEAIQSQVLAGLGLPNNSFEAGTTAATIGNTFQISMLAADGIDSTDAVFHYNQHDYFYYIDVSGYTITRQYMMNHGNIVSQFTAWATQVQQATTAGKPYLLGEMAAVGPQGLAEITDVFGCALWSLDFFLYASTINITHVLMHMTDIGNQSAWQPITLGDIAPWVRPVYYGHIVMDSLIGPYNDTTIAEIDLRSQELQDYAGLASAYVVYHGNQIYAAVLINFKEFNQSMIETSDTQLNFTINVPHAFAGNNLTVFKLSAPGADSFKGVTWQGIDFQTDDGKPASADVNDTSFVTVSESGQLSVLVRDTQAAVVVFNQSSGVFLDPPPATLSGSPSPAPANHSNFTNSTDPSPGASSRPSMASKHWVGNVFLITLLWIGMTVMFSN